MQMSVGSKAVAQVKSTCPACMRLEFNPQHCTNKGCLVRLRPAGMHTQACTASVCGNRVGECTHVHIWKPDEDATCLLLSSFILILK